LDEEKDTSGKEATRLRKIKKRSIKHAQGPSSGKRPESKAYFTYIEG